MKLSPHFTLAELTRSDAALRFGLDNTPFAVHIANLKATADALEFVRAGFGGRPLIVTSAYRSPAVNRTIGGSLTSAHMQGLAADFTVPGVTNIEVCRWIEKNLPGFDQVIYEFGPGGWVHLGLRTEHPRQQALTATRRNHATVYVPGIQALWGEEVPS